MICARCGETTSAYSMSVFNTDECCLDCIEKERQHPKFEEAAEAELAAVRRGDLNFPGIGKPDDL